MAYELPAYGDENWHTKLNASIEAVKESAEDAPLFARYASSWPARPTADATRVVIWVGGTPDTPPTAYVAGVDLWYVPNTP